MILTPRSKSGYENLKIDLFREKTLLRQICFKKER